MGDFLPSPGPGAFSEGFNAVAGPSRARTRHGLQLEEELDVLEEDEYQMAKGYFDLKEFDRVTWVLRDARGNRAKFLRTYAAFLVGLHSVDYTPGPS